MKITKLGHSCLLVEMPEPVNRTALFDPGIFSTVDVDSLEFLDDIIITHSHSDHFDIELLKKLVAKFPEARITAPEDVVAQLQAEDIKAGSAASDGIVFFESPHEEIRPLFASAPPPEVGVHYLDKLSHPGDSHSFIETKAILALPVQAPWGAPRRATELAYQLKPKYVIPIHDWHWSGAARQNAYDTMEKAYAEQGITFLKPVSGEAFVLDV